MATFTLHARHHLEQVKAAQTRARIALETGTVDQHENHPRALPGDPLRLRGVPILARGISGEIRGSRP